MMLKQEKSKARQAFCETLPIFPPSFHTIYFCVPGGGVTGGGMGRKFCSRATESGLPQALRVHGCSG